MHQENITKSNDKNAETAKSHVKDFWTDGRRTEKVKYRSQCPT